MTLTTAQRHMLSDLYWWGPATFYRCEVTADPVGVDVGIVGVPHSSGNGTTERDQHLGPRAFRNASMAYRRVLRHSAFDPWTSAVVRDLGDVPMLNFMVCDLVLGEIEEHLRTLTAAGVRVLSIGGDHSVPLPVLRAMSSATGFEPLALVHFDAHSDTYDDYPTFYGVKDSAAHWVSRALDEGLVDPAATFQLGLRGNEYESDPAATAHARGLTVIERDEYVERGGSAIGDSIREQVGDRRLYISFDLDCLDPSVAPGVANLEPEVGLTLADVTSLLRRLAGMDVIGSDIVCMMPTKDSPNGITALAAAAVGLDLVTLMADAARAYGSQSGAGLS